VDFKDGGALERPAREIPAVPDVPSSVPEWVRAGAFEEILFALAEYLRERGGIGIREAFIDGTFAPAKKGAPEWARRNGAKARRSWPLQTLLVFLSPLTWKVLRRMK
jgi:hypothetical protein